jgi:anti-sigma B factor antagonist
MGRLSCLEVAQVPEIGFPVEVVEGVPVVTAPEEIDITNAGGLQVALFEAIGPGSALVIVDMSRTRFCDSAGLNALVNADRRARAEGGELRLVIVAESIVRVVALTGVDRVIAIYASLEEALTYAGLSVPTAALRRDAGDDRSHDLADGLGRWRGAVPAGEQQVRGSEQGGRERADVGVGGDAAQVALGGEIGREHSRGLGQQRDARRIGTGSRRASPPGLPTGYGRRAGSATRSGGGTTGNGLTPGTSGSISWPHPALSPRSRRTGSPGCWRPSVPLWTGWA